MQVICIQSTALGILHICRRRGWDWSTYCS